MMMPGKFSKHSSISSSVPSGQSSQSVECGPGVLDIPESLSRNLRLQNYFCNDNKVLFAFCTHILTWEFSGVSCRLHGVLSQ